MVKLFQPLGGLCPHCGNPVNIVEGLVYDYTLDEDGNPNMLNSESYKVAAFCKHCCEGLYVEPNDHGGYTVYPDFNAITSHISMLNSVFGDYTNLNRRSSALAVRLLESDNNPFVNDFSNDNQVRITTSEQSTIDYELEDDIPF